ncbi:MAG: transposase [Methylovirgula sp.]
MEESLAPGANISEVARRHDISRSLLFQWRRQVTSEGASHDAAASSPTFVPLMVAHGEASEARGSDESMFWLRRLMVIPRSAKISSMRISGFSVGTRLVSMRVKCCSFHNCRRLKRSPSTPNASRILWSLHQQSEILVLHPLRW